MKIRKYISLIVSLAMIMYVISAAICVSANTASTLGIDVLFLVDASGSMSKNDPDGARFEAIRSFVGQCIPGRTRVGAMFFNSEIHSQMDTINIESFEDIEGFYKRLDNYKTVDDKTDIGFALNEAVKRIIQDEGSEEGKCIILLSDGKTVMDPQNTERTIEDSEADLEAAIKSAKAADIPIYTVGLNAGENLDIEQLVRISEQTGAGETQIIDDPKALNDKFLKIIAYHTGSEIEKEASFVSTGDYEDVMINISDNSVLYANILINHDKPIEDIKLYDEKGSEVLIDNTRARIIENTNQSVLRLDSPSKGSWKLSIKSPSLTNVEVSLICLRDYKVAAEIFTSSEIKNGCKLKMNYSIYCNDDDKEVDEVFLSLVNGKAIITDKETGESQEIELTSDKNSFKGEFILPDDHNYEVYGVIYSSNSNIRSSVTSLEFGSEEFIEPLSPFVYIGAGAAALIILIALVLFIRNRATRLKLVSGRFVINVMSRAVPSRGNVNFDLAQNCLGKYQQSLKMALDSIFGVENSAKILPADKSSKITFHFDKLGNMCFKNVPGVNVYGGSTINNESIVASRGTVKVEYIDPTVNSKTVISIQFIA